jgi:selenide,water dikinase
VTGVIHPKQVLAKKNLRLKDNLVLTKPLGTGIVNTAIKADMVSEQLSEKVTLLMAALNRDAAKIMADFDISACTDVTGFGLLGHLAEMVNGSGCSVRIFSEQVPVIPEAEDFAAMGLIPAGAYKNREFREQMITFAETVPRTLQDLLFDPQTSGGLLISVSEVHCNDLVSALKKGGIADAVWIGDVVHSQEEIISVI